MSPSTPSSPFYLAPPVTPIYLPGNRPLENLTLDDIAESVNKGQSFLDFLDAYEYALNLFISQAETCAERSFRDRAILMYIAAYLHAAKHCTLEDRKQISELLEMMLTHNNEQQISLFLRFYLANIDESNELACTEAANLYSRLAKNHYSDNFPFFVLLQMNSPAPKNPIPNPCQTETTLPTSGEYPLGAYPSITFPQLRALLSKIDRETPVSLVAPDARLLDTLPEDERIKIRRLIIGKNLNPLPEVPFSQCYELRVQGEINFHILFVWMQSFLPAIEVVDLSGATATGEWPDNATSLNLPHVRKILPSSSWKKASLNQFLRALNSAPQTRGQTHVKATFSHAKSTTFLFSLVGHFSTLKELDLRSAHYSSGLSDQAIPDLPHLEIIHADGFSKLVEVIVAKAPHLTTLDLSDPKECPENLLHLLPIEKQAQHPSFRERSKVLPKEQIQQVPYDEVRYIDLSRISDLTCDQMQHVQESQVEALKDEDFEKVSNEQWENSSALVKYRFLPLKLLSINPPPTAEKILSIYLQVEKVPFCLLRFLPPNLLATLPSFRTQGREFKETTRFFSDEQIQSLPPSAISHLHPEKIQALTKGQIAYLRLQFFSKADAQHFVLSDPTKWAFAHPTLQEYALTHLKITKDQLVLSSDEVLRYFTPETCPPHLLPYLKPEHLTCIQRSVVEASIEDFKDASAKFSKEQIQALPEEVIPFISASKTNEVSDGQLLFLELESFSKLNSERILQTDKEMQSAIFRKLKQVYTRVFPDHFLFLIPPEEIQQRLPFTHNLEELLDNPDQQQAFTSSTEHLSKEQIQALDHELVPLIAPSKAKLVSEEQIPYLTPHQIRRMSYEELAYTSPARWKLASNAVRAALPSMLRSFKDLTFSSKCLVVSYQAFTISLGIFSLGLSAALCLTPIFWYRRSNQLAKIIWEGVSAQPGKILDWYDGKLKA